MSHTAVDLTEKLNAVTAADFQGNDVLRQQLALAARKLFHTLETKEEKILRLTIEEPAVFSALQVLIDVDLWDTWTAAGGGEKDVDELAMMTKKDVDPELLRHLLPLLASNHILNETGEGRYMPTDFSLSIGNVSTLVAPALRWRTDHVTLSNHHFPEFLAKTNYRKPLDDNISCYKDAYPERMNFWERCKSNATYFESFSAFMTLWTKGKRPWPQYYDTEALLQGADLSDGGVFVVDVGGHHGMDLLRVLEKHPDIPASSLVLKDLPGTIAVASLAQDKFKVVGHNFFEPQPIKGSRAYYMHAVLHDWPDEKAVEILKHIAAVMKPGYSKVLINDIILPAIGTSCYQAAMDCIIMQMSSTERTEAMWKKVIEEAGLKLVKIWPDGRGNESLIEVELP
ncbi:putative O-methyltransferase [Xylogone sp. PMI_703]|nr:putative O-methyltransferase [Xylogone sp. PMI_703]